MKSRNTVNVTNDDKLHKRVPANTIMAKLTSFNGSDQTNTIHLTLKFILFPEFILEMNSSLFFRTV